MSGSTNKITELTELIRNEAIRLGFLACGFSNVRELSDIKPVYNKWIESGFHGDMHYMSRNTDKRLNPALLVENCKTVISLLYNYFTTDKLVNSTYKISKYAYGTDYHDVIHERLTLLDKYIRLYAGEDINQRCFVDSAPVMERHWAQSAGLGWIGKNSCLLSRQHGSFVFISEIITSLELETDVPVADYCGSCRKCIDACPTEAITENRLINSKKCISYQTIENKSKMPEDLKGKFSGFIFGCDICQDVCPWNKKAHPHNEPLFALRAETVALSDEQWETLTETEYLRIFKKSAVKRTKLIGLKRNINFVKNSSF